MMNTLLWLEGGRTVVPYSVELCDRECERERKSVYYIALKSFLLMLCYSFVT
jgi:hypothetical protein